MREPYYQEDGITIYHGDCREILPDLPEVDLVLTDPPYGIDKAEWDDSFPIEWFDLLRTKVLGLMPGIWNLIKMPEEIAGMKYIWCLSAYLKNGMTRGAIGFGNWIPCLVYVREGASAYVQDGDCREFIVGRDPKPNHPSPKPYEAMLWFCKRLPGATVLDPFMGSGTTLKAAKELGREAIGIEIQEKYCEIAVERLAQGVLALH